MERSWGSISLAFRIYAFARPPAPDGPVPNRLAQETSPYLLQHAGNPVDWHPWGDEALPSRVRRIRRFCSVSAMRRAIGAM